jgi:citrate lyase subunit beta-like protein
MLYVPGSSDKMIKKSQESLCDCIIFDLEDSVASHRKGAARESVLHGLNAAPRSGPELAVRINPPSGSIHLASDDLDIILPSRQLDVSFRILKVERSAYLPIS